ncbi:D-inositol-3-phosphate glycosyltransferase [Pseudomonas fluorescens]|nr:D-inositol-3-phosphate glycosyltransferase [Pseudomonas fluorescens]
MNKQKILFLLQLPPPIHGASVVNKSIQDSFLINNALNARFVNISPAKDLSDIGKLSIGKLFTFFRIYLSAISAFFQLKPNLVYLTLSPHGLAFYKDGLIAITMKLLGGKLVFHLHGKGIRKETSKSWLKKNLYRWVFNKVDIIHLAESLFPDVEDIRDHSKSIIAIANGVDPIDETNFSPKDEIFTFIYLSNLKPSKGADLIVRAATLIPAKYQSCFQVKIVGKPSVAAYLTEIERLVIKNPFGNIEILGPLYGLEKIKQLTSSNVFILPTRFKNECFPLSILEAMASGLAVISTNEGAIPDIIETGVTGEIITDCTPEVLAQAMTKHITDQNYSALCSKHSREQFNLKYTSKIFEEKLASTLQALAK